MDMEPFTTFPGANIEPKAAKLGTRATIVTRLKSEHVLILLLGALILLFKSKSPYFFTFGNFENILLSIAVLGILAVPSTMLFVAAHVDLSVASIAAVCGMVVAQYGNEHGFLIGILMGLVAGILAGALNGTLVILGISSIIATLGTLSIFRGYAKLLSNGQTVPITGFRTLGSGSTIGLPNAILILFIVAAIFVVLLRFSVFGRSIYAIGSNPHAARLSGLRVRLSVFAAFVLTGACAALAGMILTSQLRAATPVAGMGLELSVVAAVLLGGASLDGGRGTVGGTILGVLILGTLNNGMTIISVSAFWQEIARGVVLITAVGIGVIRTRLSAR